jgi:hypothetical protein
MKTKLERAAACSKCAQSPKRLCETWAGFYCFGELSTFSAHFAPEKPQAEPKLNRLFSMAEKEKLESTTTLFRRARAVAANKRIVSNSIPYLLRDAENDLFIRTLA